MSDSELGNSVHPATSSRCWQKPCSYCYLHLKHNSSEEDVLQRCRDSTNALRSEIRARAFWYVYECGAARHILAGMGSTAQLPVPLSAQELVGVHTSADFAEAIVPIGDPSRPPPGRGVKRAWRAGALSGSATVEPTEAGSDNNFTGQKWWMDADEYPQWQYKSGKNKKKWSAYDHDSNQLLEEAHSRGIGTVLLKREEWTYMIHFVGDFQQVSLDTGTRREVRRLTGPAPDWS